uniref:Uncharacterized protein n=2 Tax=Caenorhabditis tropicalis TaxID=1561998 RepID=A0A1I7TSA3_9PELO
MNQRKPVNRILWQSRMQSETDRAVYGILCEDPTLNQYPSFQPGRYIEQKKTKSAPKYEEDEVQNKLRRKAEQLRDEMEYRLMVDRRNKEKEEMRMKKWRIEQRKIVDPEVVGMFSWINETGWNPDDNSWLDTFKKELEESRKRMELQNKKKKRLSDSKKQVNQKKTEPKKVKKEAMKQKKSRKKNAQLKQKRKIIRIR